MCHYESQSSAPNNSNQGGDRLYPNLSDLLHNLLDENQRDILRDMLASRRDQSETYQHGPQFNQEPRPSAPPPGPPQQEPRSQEPELDELSQILSGIGRRAAQGCAQWIGILSLLFPILLAPKCLLVFGIFTAFLKSLGIPIIPWVLAGLGYEILTALDPILITCLAIWTIWKVLILKRPLVDVPFWKEKMGRFCRHQY